MRRTWINTTRFSPPSWDGRRGSRKLSPTVLSTTFSEKPSKQFSISNEIELGLSKDPFAGLFSWTLSHPSRAFCEIKPVFESQSELVEYAMSNVIAVEDHGLAAEVSNEITKIALAKINNEWRAWVNVHSDFSFDERKLDNMLMASLYWIILDRDDRRCVLCAETHLLTIHHVIQKRRNVLKSAPPFGRSVPTNLVTLCRSCHSMFDPAILS